MTVDSERFRYRMVLHALLEPWFAPRPVAEVERCLARTSLLWSRFRSFLDVVQDEDVARNAIVGPVDQPSIGRCSATGSPLRFHGQGRQPEPAPALGAHTDEVLMSVLGLDRQELTELHAEGVLGPLPSPD